MRGDIQCLVIIVCVVALSFCLQSFRSPADVSVSQPSIRKLTAEQLSHLAVDKVSLGMSKKQVDSLLHRAQGLLLRCPGSDIPGLDHCYYTVVAGSNEQTQVYYDKDGRALYVIGKSLDGVGHSYDRFTKTGLLLSDLKQALGPPAADEPISTKWRQAHYPKLKLCVGYDAETTGVASFSLCGVLPLARPRIMNSSH
jgi:hypothetical protein